jgi:hypothetical protein
MNYEEISKFKEVVKEELKKERVIFKNTTLLIIILFLFLCFSLTLTLSILSIILWIILPISTIISFYFHQKSKQAIIYYEISLTMKIEDY